MIIILPDSGKKIKCFQHTNFLYGSFAFVYSMSASWKLFHISAIVSCKTNPCNDAGTAECKEDHDGRRCLCKPGYFGDACKEFRSMFVSLFV